MSNRRSNYPPAQQISVEPGEMALMVQRMEELRNHEIPKSDDELEERIHEFFEWCIRHDQRPGVELLSLFCGTSRQNLWKWQQAGGRRGELITQAKQVIIALLESWGLTGRINPAALIFLLKNHAAYSDDIHLQLEPQQPALEAYMSPEQVRQQLEQDIPIDTDFDAD